MRVPLENVPSSVKSTSYAPNFARQTIDESALGESFAKRTAKPTLSSLNVPKLETTWHEMTCTLGAAGVAPTPVNATTKATPKSRRPKPKELPDQVEELFIGAVEMSEPLTEEAEYRLRVGIRLRQDRGSNLDQDLELGEFRRRRADVEVAD